MVKSGEKWRKVGKSGENLESGERSESWKKW